MSERTLILLRHSKSDWSGNQDDIDRPLAERGRRQAPEAGRWLGHNVDTIDLVVSSPAKRARSTWGLAADELAGDPPARVDDRLYAASPDQLLEVVHELPVDADTVVLVGHNPGIEQLVSVLTGVSVRLRTSALAVIELTGPWSSAGSSKGVLRASGRPPTG